MRSFSVLQEAIVPYVGTLIAKLTEKLMTVSKVSIFLDIQLWLISISLALLHSLFCFITSWCVHVEVITKYINTQRKKKSYQ